MLFKLNTEKSGLLIIGDITFTFDEPGPVEISLESSSAEIFNQLVYSCKTGILKCGDPDKLIAMIEKQKKPPFRSQAAVAAPVRPVKKDETVLPGDPIEEDLKDLKSLLKKNVSSVKKELPGLSPGRLRKLAELEKTGKNRKALLSLLTNLLNKHADTVAKNVSGSDIAGTTHEVGISVGSPQVSDIIDSEIEEVTIYPSED